ncbi:hypothetical protein [Pseudomonas brassicacearum]|uniref:Uncharacterized protein n=1 Tax=Pseudomonas brassicacearum TaxID=930166 RepID=A0A423GKM8_9PSED|nr:hypothetical protein [Pseudomonas brassicacearum]ROM91070.1 hypothetical protein BK658_24540 [Pseudomonas brassicacearum]
MNKTIKLYWIPILLLAAFTLITFYTYHASTDEIQKNIALSLATSLLSTTLAAIIINFYISYKENKNQEQLNRIALNTLVIPIAQFSSFIFNIIKATARTPGEDSKTPHCKHIKSLQAAQVRALDASSTAPIYPNRTWEIYFLEQLSQLNNSIVIFLERHSTLIEHQTLDLCNKIITHNFFMLANSTQTIKTLSSVPDNSSTLYFLASDDSDTPIMIDFLNMVGELADTIFRVTGSANFEFTPCWRNDIAPHIGSALRENHEEDERAFASRKTSEY